VPQVLQSRLLFDLYLTTSELGFGMFVIGGEASYLLLQGEAKPSHEASTLRACEQYITAY
jgi:hypothetical protein